MTKKGPTLGRVVSTGSTFLQVSAVYPLGFQCGYLSKNGNQSKTLILHTMYIVHYQPAEGDTFFKHRT